MNQNSDSGSSSGSSSGPTTPRLDRPTPDEMISKFEDRNNREIYESKQDREVTLGLLRILSDINSEGAIENFADYLRTNNSAKQNINNPDSQNEIAEIFQEAHEKGKTIFCNKILDSIDNSDILRAIKQKIQTNTPNSNFSPDFTEKLDTKIKQSKSFCVVS